MRSKRAFSWGACGVLGLALSLLGAGCATNFQGSAHVGGAAACARRCSAQGMELAGIVYMGDYSSACVCEVPGRSVSPGSVAASTGGAVAGVAMQSRRNNDANR